MGEIEDALKALVHHTSSTNKLFAIYLARQATEQNKTPENSPPRVFNLWNVILPQPQALQIIAAAPNRHKVGIANTGPANILYSTQWFDPTTLLQRFSDPVDSDAITPGYNQSIDIGFLAAGQTVDIISVRGVWAYSLGSAAESDQNAIIAIQDSLYKIVHSDDTGVAGTGKDALRGDGVWAATGPPNTDSETASVYK
jgi:hypothetical protein